MPLTVRVQQSSRSLFAIIPKDIEDYLELKKFDTLRFIIHDNGTVELRKVCDKKNEYIKANK